MDESYREWLFEKIGVIDGPNYDYDMLCSTLDDIRFIWRKTLDRNRATKAIELREEYAYEHSVYHEDVRDQKATVLEVLIGLAEDLAEKTENDSLSGWFWIMINNLGLDTYDDDHWDFNEIVSIVNKWMYVEYDEDGWGCPFFMPDYHGDVRKLTIWDQANKFAVKNFPTNEDWLD